MIILGIETSCDETSIAIVDGRKVLANVIASQTLHQEYGGVVPEYASREHMRMIEPISRRVIDSTIKDLSKIDGIAVTYGPGLMGALLVGLSFGKGLAVALGKPFLAVNHVEAHIMANFIVHSDLDYPFLCLLVSGGHTMLVYVKSFGRYKILGTSVDDAAGEAFDKAARILGLGYPGGPIVDRLAKGGRKDFHVFPRARVKGNELNFSFSGLKTSLLYLVKRKGESWVQENLADLCASYQEAVVDMLLRNSFRAIEMVECDKLVLAGGVAANSRLREVFRRSAEDIGVKLYFPVLEYCTDNAAMVAFTGYEMLRRGITSPLDIPAVPALKFDSTE
ncbi:MAG: tRNA (adenosine(37)-N6)-threonylcarbamoyltransferase complex transferase subunit TsaD [Candidatus Marinimicrobia bacterium]|nr:tRNA (adenosine(37)-N6)-threonylcarbamoyltransferase complex transferase subunit TsaD [Candidatus Neomarinimicrobiota bacterium]RKY47596.1 MAG: tRNA (adenosine(37)-N6)-threonylcarbamoyltransferase complex transferase subunit TsaD [Candidatus Neomarinimicrobiota bacterium]